MKQGPLPYFLLAATQHPDKQFQKKLWSELERWLDEVAPVENSNNIIAVLKNEKGTLLEPFELSEIPLKVAAFLCRLTLFNKFNRAYRFRICSELTIGNSGGLVVTNNLKSFYSEVYVLGKNRLLNSNTRFYAPSMSHVGLGCFHSSDKLFASVEADDEGIFIFLSIPTMLQIGWIASVDISQLSDLARKLSNNSKIGIKKLATTTVGLAFKAVDNGIKISAKSPESIIRFTSYLVQGEKLYLSCMSNYDAEVALPKEAEGQATIRVSANDLFAIDWMDVRELGAPVLDQADISKIGEWAFFHNDLSSQTKGDQ